MDPYKELAWEFYKDLKHIDEEDLTQAEKNFIRSMDEIKEKEENENGS